MSSQNLIKTLATNKILNSTVTLMIFKFACPKVHELKISPKMQL